MSTVCTEHFYGVDLTSAPQEVQNGFLPCGKNLGRGPTPGALAGRPAAVLLRRYTHPVSGEGLPVWGFHPYTGIEGLVHAGEYLFLNKQVVASGLANAKSSSYLFEDRLILQDGAHLWVYNGSSLLPAEGEATVPYVMVNTPPNGLGTKRDARNMLTDRFKQTFVSDGAATAYQLCFFTLASANVTVEQQFAIGGPWQVLAPSSYTVNPASGKITFASAPAALGSGGVANLRVTARYGDIHYTERISACRFGALYGEDPATPRLFLGGNPAYTTTEFVSQQGDPLYFSEADMRRPAEGEILGYAKLGELLITYTKGQILFRRAQSGAMQFVYALGGPDYLAGAAGLAEEPLYLSAEGIFALTKSELSAERSSEVRSYYLNGQLLKEKNLENAFAIVFDEQYLLFVNGCVYVLDGRQPLKSPLFFVQRQYAAFVWADIFATAATVQNGQLLYGDARGNVFCLQGPKSVDCVFSRGEEFWGPLTHLKKVEVQVLPAPGAVLRILAGAETLLDPCGAERQFSWAEWDWHRFCWNADAAPRTFAKTLTHRTNKPVGVQIEGSLALLRLTLRQSAAGRYK